VVFGTDTGVCVQGHVILRHDDIADHWVTVSLFAQAVVVTVLILTLFSWHIIVRVHLISNVATSGYWSHISLGAVLKFLKSWNLSWNVLKFKVCPEILTHVLKFVKAHKFMTMAQGIWEIFEIVAVRCHLLRLKCTKFDFGWGSAPDPARGAYSPPSPSSWICGAYF